jgi:hypothetical protein
VSLNSEEMLEGYLDDPRELLRVADAINETRGDLLYHFLRLHERGLVRIHVTDEGLAAIARDGMVRVRGVDHVQDCETVRLAARGARRPGVCTCGSLT